jgi:hypothetical protein
MEASLDLFDTVIILFSLSFLSLENFRLTSNLGWDGKALVGKYWIYPILVGVVPHLKLEFSLRLRARGTSPE